MVTPIFSLDDIDLNDISDSSSDTELVIHSENLRPLSRAIAIIGMDGKVGEAENLELFWELLVNEREGLKSLSEQRRRDLDNYTKTRGLESPLPENAYVKGTFLTDLTGFDPLFFGISQQEAKYMDPNQKIFLETAWKALEDSGYGGKEIQGSDTGIYVGFSSDFGEAYRHMLTSLDPDASEVAVAGNIKSIIASRLAYHLDLRGPALLVDTACSSGLMAMYLACRSIQSRECYMAIAGAVKCDLVPLLESKESRVGIKDIQDTFAQDGHTRTFDNACAGTTAAEGSFAFVLKSLEAAVRDGDTIRAVILGGAANQDGASNGITAPNSEAQEMLIVRALRDAGVSAESISYIEAHGTATRLGDPIEVSGIQRAFKHFTNKKQFCAIGSLKTNIGHLDNAAGLGGVAKIVLAMQQRVLPASLNFAIPNRSIPFVQSPVYVNNQTVSWPGDQDKAVRAGINSFGLSGTNCHLIMESAPVLQQRSRSTEPGPLLLPLSAKNEMALKQLAAAYSNRIAESTVDLADVVMTASRGRLHHNLRLVVVFETRDQLCSLLERYANNGPEMLSDTCLFYGEHRLIADGMNRRRSTDITEMEQERMSHEAMTMIEGSQHRPTKEVLLKWAQLYIAGGELPWSQLTIDLEARRIPLPTYPFQHIRCWPEPSQDGTDTSLNPLHPLLGTSLVHTIGHTLIKSILGPETHWELAEHKIQGTYLLPGTALVEMMMDYAGRHNGQDMSLYFKDIRFEQPFMVDHESSKELHLLAEDDGGRTHLRFASLSSDGEWVQHAEGFWYNEDVIQPDIHSKVDLEAIRARMNRSVAMDSSEDLARGLELGGRWVHSFVSGMIDDSAEEFLIELSLPAEYMGDEAAYTLHPALMDNAVNAANNMMGEGELYLPLSYGKLVVHRRLPARFFTHLRKTHGVKGDPVHRFDINLYDAQGSLVVEIRNYCIKSASEAFSGTKGANNYGRREVYRPYPLPMPKQLPSGTVVLAGRISRTYERLLQALKERGHRVMEITSDSGDWEQPLKLLSNEWLSQAIFVWDTPGALSSQLESWGEVDEAVYQGAAFLKAWSTARLKTQAGVIALTHRGWSVGDDETDLHPGQAALGGLWRVGALEFETMNLRCIDQDEETSSDVMLDEFADVGRPTFLAYRKGQAYEPVVEDCAVPTQAALPVPVHSGMFVLSGGTGSLGMEVAGLLARRGVKRMALLGYRTIPARDSWEHLVESSMDAELVMRLKQWLELERVLEVLEVRSVRIEDFEAVAALMSELRSDHGPIQGVIHLAGRAGSGFLFQKTEETFREVYAPKANGALNLHLVTLEDQPEIFIQFSSISSLLLNPGQSDYTAANMFMDSLAAYRRQMGLPALSLQWPAWRETGIAWRMNAVDEDELFTPLNTDEALALFDRIVWRGQELPPVIMPGRTFKTNGYIQQKPKMLHNTVPQKRTQITLLGITEPDEFDLEVAGIWARTLELDKVEADDEFSSIGGNSLLTSQMLREYEKIYPGIMEIADLFTYTTIHKQAGYVREQLGKAASAATAPITDFNKNLDEILELVATGELTVEESSSRLANKKMKEG
ncbi:beta-ketoacyl synthase N-terminal-like domain-containing protein [Paenibacillus sp. FSL R7-0337]|uniref:beta-ketoacyl synthase N-terminal-like domain-containing protein n=1 Tax=Paenibacillus sp. FSL R7-0337 TaxID=1926588 RepID=UPI00096EFE1C|nr:beta-ketoacyl synthase N-terminal-like domain-containing protein [Paenibacillus sp. FSL R7-0337]OMF91665.1 hypothetical protein BK147_20935 [Paenibacillus sp. FSL R7-0337]